MDNKCFDAIGQELFIGDKVYYSGASKTHNFAVGYVREIIFLDPEINIRLGESKYRRNNQVIKIPNQQKL